MLQHRAPAGTAADLTARWSNLLSLFPALGDLEPISALALKVIMNRLLEHLRQGFVLKDAEKFQRAMLAVFQRDGDARQIGCVNEI
jgi:hypothetical protein